MYTVEVSVKAKGEDTDFATNALVEYLHVKTKEDVDRILRAVAEGLFSLGGQQQQRR